jgi:peptidoglycan hydrolase FlgJ
MTTLMPMTGSVPFGNASGIAAGGTLMPGTSAINKSAASTYTDLNGLAALKRDPNSPQAISAVAEQVEALFLQMMLKSMRDASSAEDQDSNEMGMYQDMFDKQVALSISQHADLGIGRLLRRQISDQSQLAAPNSTAAAHGPSTTAATAIAPTPADFVNRLLPPIRRAAAALGLNPMGMLAQAALETGWGQRMPRTADGSSSFNVFGIKAGEGWGGARATADSMEVVNGVATPRRSAFRAYGSIEESVNDFASLLKNSPRYREAAAAGGDAQAYVDGIGKSGYATDPEYANKLNEILHGDALQATLTPRIAAL